MWRINENRRMRKNDAPNLAKMLRYTGYSLDHAFSSQRGYRQLEPPDQLGAVSQLKSCAAGIQHDSTIFVGDISDISLKLT